MIIFYNIFQFLILSVFPWLATHGCSHPYLSCRILIALVKQIWRRFSPPFEILYTPHPYIKKALTSLIYLNNYLYILNHFIWSRPTWEDMIIAYSTIPGYASLRDHYNGTWFIQSLVEGKIFYLTLLRSQLQEGGVPLKCPPPPLSYLKIRGVGYFFVY